MTERFVRQEFRDFTRKVSHRVFRFDYSYVGNYTNKMLSVKRTENNQTSFRMQRKYRALHKHAWLSEMTYCFSL